jgi:hypothetical protein
LIEIETFEHAQSAELAFTTLDENWSVPAQPQSDGTLQNVIWDV